MPSFNFLFNLKSRKDFRQQKSDSRDSSDYAPIPTLDTNSLNTDSTLSFDCEAAADDEMLDEMELFLERTIRTRYTEQDVHLSHVQEFDLELAKLTGLLERGEKYRLEAQDCNSTVLSKI
ncbi:hypothetical protein K7432_010917 [Basidiobolus ranarum]|uniref:Uncharacterized protein n=1 Tax=Basidiobolus ranarum TaxID=34480 RepID=A0ABR2VUS6_9FUNG